MMDNYLKEHGYVEYNPTVYDNESVVQRFQNALKMVMGKSTLLTF